MCAGPIPYTATNMMTSSNGHYGYYGNFPTTSTLTTLSVFGNNGFKSYSSFSYSEDARHSFASRVRALEGVLAQHYPEVIARSKELLLDNLDELQGHSFSTDGYFEVVGGSSGGTYRVHDNKRHVCANIEVLRGDRVTHALCCHCDPKLVPLYDHLLAQKLSIEFDELTFLKKANKHPRLAA